MSNIRYKLKHLRKQWDAINVLYSIVKQDEKRVTTAQTIEDSLKRIEREIASLEKLDKKLQTWAINIGVSKGRFDGVGDGE